MSSCEKIPVCSNANPTELVVCNGIDTSREEAASYVELISRYFDGQEVLCFYNPLTTAALKASRINQNVDGQEDVVKSVSNAFHSFLKQIIQNHCHIKKDLTSIRICLFLYSYGSVIANNAINMLTVSEKKTLHIYAFSPDQLVPNYSGKFVENYVFENDERAVWRNLIEHEPALLFLQEMHLKGQLGVNYDKFIFESAFRDVLKKLNPAANKSTTKQKERFCDIFYHEDPRKRILCDPLFRKRVQAYSSMCKDFNVVFLPGKVCYNKSQQFKNYFLAFINLKKRPISKL